MEINGVKVVDAKKPLTLHISVGDVKKGSNKNPSSCAAAQACLKLPGVTQAKVHISTTYIKLADKWLRFRTPGALRSEIVAFDRGGTFEAGEYTLAPMSPTLRLGVGATGSNTSKTKPHGSKKKKRKMHLVKGIRPHGANR